MRHWFKDQHMRSLLKNSSYLGASKAVAAVASIVTLALTGRALGVMLFGVLILIHSYAQAASSLSKFQTWQVVIRYGGQGLAAGRVEDFKVATGFSVGLDLLSGIVGMAVAMALLPLIGGWFGVPPEYLTITALYCLVIPTMQAMTPGGVLRTLDRFDLLSWGGVVDPIVKLFLTAAAWAADAHFLVYVAIWFASDLIGDLYQWWLTWRELRRRGLVDALKPTLKPHSLKGAWRFAIQVNLTSSLAAAWGPIARLIVGGLLGPASAAFYRVAAVLADSAQRPTDMLSRAFYPEVMKMDPKTKKPWKLMLRGAAIAGMFALVAVLLVALAGEQLIRLIFGNEFAGAYAALVVLIIAPLLAMVAFPMPPMLYALHRDRDPLVARLVGTIVYLVIVWPLALNYGLAGAAAGFVAANAVMVLILAIQLSRQYLRVRRQ